MISANENGPILLVEDDAKDIVLTLHALERSRVKNDVVVVRDGLEALNYLSESGKYRGQRSILPELVMLDLSVPKLGGMEVLRQIRAAERTCTLPVIVMTSSADEQVQLKSLGLSFVSCLRKPVEFRDFLEALLQCGLHWLVTNSSEARVAVHQFG